MIKQRHYRAGYQVAGLASVARDLRRSQTSAESLLWELLRDRKLLGFKFRRQHQIGDYVTDFFCSEAYLAIECDGLIHQTSEQWHHDQIRDAWMAAQGIRVLRFANERLLNDTLSVLEEIAMYFPSPSGRGLG